MAADEITIADALPGCHEALSQARRESCPTSMWAYDFEMTFRHIRIMVSERTITPVSNVSRSVIRIGLIVASFSLTFQQDASILTT